MSESANRTRSIDSPVALNVTHPLNATRPLTSDGHRSFTASPRLNMTQTLNTDPQFTAANTTRNLDSPSHRHLNSTHSIEDSRDSAFNTTQTLGHPCNTTQTLECAGDEGLGSASPQELNATHSYGDQETSAHLDDTYDLSAEQCAQLNTTRDISLMRDATHNTTQESATQSPQPPDDPDMACQGQEEVPMSISMEDASIKTDNHMTMSVDSLSGEGVRLSNQNGHLSTQVDGQVSTMSPAFLYNMRIYISGRAVGLDIHLFHYLRLSMGLLRLAPRAGQCYTSY